MNVLPQTELQAHLGDDSLAIVDCRFQLGKPDAGREAYEESHIPGAIYLDLEKDLSGPLDPDGEGGRHPLPDAAQLTGTLSRAGIGNDTVVVAYDDQGGAMASRLWWLLKYLGHEKVYVLDESFSAWVNVGNPVSAEIPTPAPKQFLAEVQHSKLIEMDEVREKLEEDGVKLIDSRDGARYRGEVEPIDKKAGHIPGAMNLFWGEGRTADGTWKSPEQHAARFEQAGLAKADEIIVYCGSGVTATPNVMALEEAGYTRVRLYAGSWSDWISYEGNPVATRDGE
ncbi:thiosulfate/3-mercaptopyruvate sulfurtransferase [Paenibacillus cellulosilyticus]|uniref:Thiosulfate/3-mercaptopyruvate sulfurtransferase n=1 Tax=Paenibacillus cellulosilyticus TaxID=375489 RepID=A0A2V2YNI8_9BACL|nr:sulfurtransferase [Paenibacillus cellulosilyticus]PWV97381.1 thiosulfate/3-mercaptopyruvate sulfurtransferase [Paenibacillus cellulosilyticus]QKS48575.1 sulfurtransferase [Paenibacillus cellulosilyticus]